MKYLLLPVFIVLQVISAITVSASSIATDSLSDQLMVTSVDSLCGAIILDEETELFFHGKKNSLIQCTYTKRVKLRILNREGVSEFSSFTLPSPIDPTLIHHVPEKRNPGFYIGNLQVEYFNAKLKHLNSSWHDADIRTEIYQKKAAISVENRFTTYNFFDYLIDSVQIGDELEVSYRWSAPFYDNTENFCSFRMFFHDSLTKINSRFTLAHDDDIFVRLSFYNEGEPDSTYKDKSSNYYIWKNRNLPGCINEEGSRPYLELPFVEYAMLPVEYIYRLPYSTEIEFIPQYVLACYFREQRQMEILRSITQGNNTNQYFLFRKFIQENLNGITNDPLGIKALERVHDKIADDFTFSDDCSFFSNRKIYDEDLGDNATAKSLRDVSRYTFYSAVISSLGLGYFSAYPVDKRYGEISKDYIQSMFSNDYLIAAQLLNDDLVFIYPKYSRNGFYLDEIPFFFEGVKVRLVCLDDYKNYKKPIFNGFRETRTAKSEYKDNFRNTRVKVTMKLDSLQTCFAADLILSGQFSTLQRGVYRYDEKVPTVNPRYSHKIWAVNEQVTPVVNTISVRTTSFPYTTDIHCEYISNTSIKETDSGYLINLKNWMPFVFATNVDASDRQLAFYPDFQGRDSFSYELVFDGPIEMIYKAPEVYVWSDLGKLSFETRQTGPNTVLLTGSFTITKESCPADQIVQVDRFIQKIREIDEAFLVVKRSGT